MNSTKRTMIYLCSPSKKKICVLNGVDDLSVKLTLNGTDYNSLIFDVNKYITINGKKKESNGYSSIKSKMYLLLQNADKGNGYYKLTTEPTKSNDGNMEKLSVSANSVECELADKDLVNFKINTGEIDSCEYLDESNVGADKLAKEYVTFYNSINPKLSLLNLAISKLKGWTIGYVDPALTTITTSPARNPKYTFSIESEDVYSFLRNTVSKYAKCVFDFDIENFKINAYAIENIGKNTGVIISLRNLANSIKVSCSENSIYTCFRVAGGDGIDNIAEGNFGDNYIEDLSYYMQEPFMENSLVTKYEEYLSYRESRRSDYITAMKSYVGLNSKANEIMNRVPSDELRKNTWDGYTVYELQEQLAFYEALKGIVEKDPQYQTNGVFDIEKLKLVPLYYTYECYQPIIDNIKVAFENCLRLSSDTELNKMQITFTKEKNDILSEFTVGNVVDWTALNASDKKYTYDSLCYCIPLVQNYIINYSTEKTDKIDFPTAWESNWELFGVSELTSKLQLYDKTLGILKKTFDVQYLTNPYTYATLPDAQKAKYVTESYYITKKKEYQDQLKLYNDCDSALTTRTNEYNDYDSQAKAKSTEISQIVYDVDITRELFGFTDEDITVLNRLKNYTDYTNSNVISVSTDTLVDDIDSKLFLLNDAKEQLYIKAHPQFTFETEIDNLFALDEFKVWHGDFSLWNFINLEVTEKYMEKLRIVSMEFNPFDKYSNNLTVTFSNGIRTNQGVSDFTTLLGDMASANKNSITRGDSSTSSSTESQMLSNIIQLLTYNSQFKTAVNDVANKVTAETQIQTSEQISKNAVISNKTYKTVLDWAYEDTLDGEVAINGGALKAQSVVSDKLATNAIMSLNYPPSTTGYFSDSGTFFDLENGAITSKNFSIDGSGNARFKGIIETKAGGKIGGWTISDKDLYNNSSGMSSNTYEHYAFWAGETNDKKGALGTDAKFRVGHAGDFYSISGNIGGWSISSTSIYRNFTDRNNNTSTLTLGANGLQSYDGSNNIVQLCSDSLYCSSNNSNSSCVFSSTGMNLASLGGNLTLSSQGVQSIGGSVAINTLATTNGYVSLGNNNGTITNYGKTECRGNGFKLFFTTPYIDFHYNNSSSGYTSRIIEFESGKLNCLATLFTPTGTVSTSDRNKKIHVSDFTEQHEKFFMLLIGKVFKFVDGKSGRSHWGWYAQDIEDAIEQVGLTSIDFAGFCIDTMIDEETGEKQEVYGLRYEEFISLNTHMTQKALKKCDTFEKDIENLKDEILDLKSR